MVFAKIVFYIFGVFLAISFIWAMFSFPNLVGIVREPLSCEGAVRACMVAFVYTIWILTAMYLAW